MRKTFNEEHQVKTHRVISGVPVHKRDKILGGHIDETTTNGGLKIWNSELTLNE